ncbi:reverse transcriptase domain-containing protein [Artemisia annua]|uniref:Reverse transcriptase domain-containing protein n=1 Tax=Artemisia annua TaxID=35608 RepID=A0A2U1NFC2_ARTAN|nr:reverse transcriptase domain-containing protein [Artemisia annua]
MSNKKRKLKWKIKVPDTHENSVGDLGRNRDNNDKNEDVVVSGESVNVNDDVSNGDREVIGEKEASDGSKVSVAAEVNEFPPLNECIHGNNSVENSDDKDTSANSLKEICQEGNGSIGYGRVLIEINAEKEIKDTVEICYKNKQAETIGSKFVKVEYGWKPPRCTACKVFGYIDANCNVLNKNENKKAGEKVRDENRRNGNGENMEKGNSNANMGYNVSKRNGIQAKHDNRKDVNEKGRRNPQVRLEFRTKTVVEDQNVNKKDNAKAQQIQTQSNKENSPKKTWNVEKGLMEELRNNANKYTVLEDRIEDGSMENDLCRDKNGKSLSIEENIVKENEDVDIFILWQKQEEMVDMFVNDKRIPTDEELETWARYMCECHTPYEPECPYAVCNCIFLGKGPGNARAFSEQHYRFMHLY